MSRRLSQAIDAYGEDMHEMNIHSVLFATITVKQFVSLEIPGYVTSSFNNAPRMVMITAMLEILLVSTMDAEVEKRIKIQQLKITDVFKALEFLPGDEVKKMPQGMIEKDVDIKPEDKEVLKDIKLMILVIAARMHAMQMDLKNGAPRRLA